MKAHMAPRSPSRGPEVSEATPDSTRERGPLVPRYPGPFRFLKRPVLLALPTAFTVGYAALFIMRRESPEPSDPLDYFRFAQSFPAIDDASHWSLRIGILFPVRILQEIFGYSEAAYYLLPFAGAVAAALSTYYLGARFFGLHIGVASALLILAAPGFLETATELRPDVPGTALMTTGFAFVVATVTGQAGWKHHKRTYLLLVLAGLSFAWAYLIREYTALLFPVVPLLFLQLGLPLRKLVWSATPAAIVWLGEVAINLAVYDAPLARLLVSGSHGGSVDEPDSRAYVLLNLPRVLWNSPLHILFIAAVPLIIGIAMKHRAVWFFAIWLGVAWLPLTLASGILDPSYQALRGEAERYWLIVMPALVIGGVGSFQYICERAGARAAKMPQVRTIYHALIAGSVILGATVSVVQYAGRDTAWADSSVGELRSWLHHHDTEVDRVFTDYRSAAILPMYERSFFGRRLWHGEIARFHVARKLVVRPEHLTERDVLIVYKPGQQASTRRGGAPAPDYLSDPSLTRVLTSSDGTLHVYQRR